MACRAVVWYRRGRVGWGWGQVTTGWKTRRNDACCCLPAPPHLPTHCCVHTRAHSHHSARMLRRTPLRISPRHAACGTDGTCRITSSLLIYSGGFCRCAMPAFLHTACAARCCLLLSLHAPLPAKQADKTGWGGKKEGTGVGQGVGQGHMPPCTARTAVPAHMPVHPRPCMPTRHAFPGRGAFHLLQQTASSTIHPVVFNLSSRHLFTVSMPPPCCTAFRACLPYTTSCQSSFSPFHFAFPCLPACPILPPSVDPSYLIYLHFSPHAILTCLPAIAWHGMRMPACRHGAGLHATVGVYGVVWWGQELGPGGWTGPCTAFACLHAFSPFYSLPFFSNVV